MNKEFTLKEIAHYLMIVHSSLPLRTKTPSNRSLLYTSRRPGRHVYNIQYTDP
jgi:hypothetical protein